MGDDWQIPENHPIDTETRARAVMALISQPTKEFIASCCVPLYWWRTAGDDALAILGNGTVTLVQTPARTIGITANHVVTGCLEAFDTATVVVQIADASLHDLRARLISRSDELDLATFDLSGLVCRFGKGWVSKAPLQAWPPVPPQEGRGILIGGYPGIAREVIAPRNVCFGIFTGLCIARTVSDDQISCLFERDYLTDQGDLLPNTNLGGISGGPLITVLESSSFLVSYRLGGIVSEASAELEKVFAKRADFIADDGRF
jgi:hypothetical protein